MTWYEALGSCYGSRFHEIAFEIEHGRREAQYYGILAREGCSDGFDGCVVHGHNVDVVRKGGFGIDSSESGDVETCLVESFNEGNPDVS